jgi:hypothetical protein
MFACLPHFLLHTEAVSFPKYSISGVNQINVRVIRKAVVGNTVEHFTSYVVQNEYSLRLEVIQNKDFQVPDSDLVLECFLSQTAARRIVIDLNEVEWTSDYSFIYTLPLVVEQSGWVSFCISTQSEIEQQSQEDRYHHTTANQGIYLSALRH